MSEGTTTLRSLTVAIGRGLVLYYLYLDLLHPFMIVRQLLVQATQVV